MKKRFAKHISFLMAIALVIGSVSYTNNTQAATKETWKSNAIITPAEGKLIGAGYIDVTFDNSMEGYTYTVYLDGKPMYWNGDDIVKTDIGEERTSESVIKTYTSADSGKTEVYTTTVSKHTLTVKAVKGSEEITSDTRTFYVSKKGMAVNETMIENIRLKDLNCSWYYNWATTPATNGADEDVAFAPMMWGGGEDNRQEMETFTTDSNYILGFNEPDIETQANMSILDCIDVWKEYISPLNIRKASLAPAAPGGNSDWLRVFMDGDWFCQSPFDGSWGLYSKLLDEDSKKWVDGVGEDVDAVVLHYYMTSINLQGLENAVDYLWEKYHKPVWVTELGLFGIKGATSDWSYEKEGNPELVATYLQDVVNLLESRPYVERYCWFSYDVDSKNDVDKFDGGGATALFEYATGKYTDLGILFASLGNPAGYNANVISPEGKFKWEERVTKEPESTDETPTSNTEVTTKNEETSTVEVISSNPTTAAEVTTKAAVQKPAVVKLSGAKNIKKKSVKLTWKKANGAKKYQLQYALNKKFTKKVKTKNTAKITLAVNKLTLKKTFFFRVRAFNDAGYGKWSNIKKVKIKK